MVRWVVGSILHGVDPLSYFSFQPVLHDWCNKGRGMCYPVCGMVHIKEPLLLIDKSSLCGRSGFPLSRGGCGPRGVIILLYINFRPPKLPTVPLAFSLISCPSPLNGMSGSAPGRNVKHFHFITYLFNLTILIQTSKPCNKIIYISTCAIRTGTF